MTFVASAGLIMSFVGDYVLTRLRELTAKEIDIESAGKFRDEEIIFKLRETGEKIGILHYHSYPVPGSTKGSEELDFCVYARFKKSYPEIADKLAEMETANKRFFYSLREAEYVPQRGGAPRD
jgi:hypothetical protein